MRSLALLVCAFLLVTAPSALAAEASEDDAAFSVEVVRTEATAPFVAIQAAWSADDRAQLHRLCGEELLVEWERRLDDFASRGWRNQVSVLETTELKEYWTLTKRDGHWRLLSIEQAQEGQHNVTDALSAAARPAAVAELLNPNGDDAIRRVVRGSRLLRMTLVAIDNATAPPRMIVELELSGRRYLQDRDTVALVEGSRDAETRWSERWTFALEGDAAAPWIVEGAGDVPSVAAEV